MGRESTDWRAAIAGALEWWQDAGVYALVDEAPRDWLARAAPPAAPATIVPAVAAPAAMPGNLREFEAWRIGPDAPDAHLGNRRFGAAGSAESALMIVTDMPERGDTDTLIGGAVGTLFDRMLAAIGRTRESVYLMPFASARPVSGRLPSELEAALGAVALHHVALVQPRRVLVLGNCPACALLGDNVTRVRGGLRLLNHPRGKTEAVASFAPRFLIETPAAKAEAWKDLLLLIEGTGW